MRCEKIDATVYIMYTCKRAYLCLNNKHSVSKDEMKHASYLVDLLLVFALI